MVSSPICASWNNLFSKHLEPKAHDSWLHTLLTNPLLKLLPKLNRENSDVSYLTLSFDFDNESRLWTRFLITKQQASKVMRGSGWQLTFKALANSATCDLNTSPFTKWIEENGGDSRVKIVHDLRNNPFFVTINPG